MQLVGLLAAFAVVVYLGTRRTPLWITMAVATGVLLLFMGHDLPAALAVAARTAVAPSTLDLVGIVGLITVLASTMRDFGFLDDLSEGLTGTLRSERLAFALIPGLLGCLPVPGGAGISAPMVDGLGQRLGLSRAQRAAANLMFRHAWFFVFPLEPALILSCRLAGVELPQLVAFQWPLTAVTLASCGLLFLRNRGAPGKPSQPWRQEVARLARSAAPIAASLLPFLAFGVPLTLSLVLGVAAGGVLAQRRGTFSWAAVARSPDWSLIGATELIMVFAGTVSGSPGLARLVQGLAGTSYPLVAFFLLPAVLGFLTANPAAGVGIAFPLLWPLLPEGTNLLAYGCLVFSLTFQAYLVSPLHMCVVLSNRYFGVTLGQSYRYVLPATAATAIATLVLFFLSR